MLLARTDPDAPRHRGLTYFLLDMEQDGVEVRPLVQITGEAEFNELFLQEARVPAANAIGGIDQGWRVAITTLMHERAGLAFALQVGVQIALGELVQELRDAGLEADPVLRQRLAQIYVEAQVLRLLAYRGVTSAQAHGEPGPEGSLGKWLWAEVNQALTELAMDAAGPRAALADGVWAARFLRARANSIEGGTTEILKTIVAERVLGLPRA
jgi:alkylation response protein AidB-like acyl-CoA dehydrogenase